MPQVFFVQLFTEQSAVTIRRHTELSGPFQPVLLHHITDGDITGLTLPGVSLLVTAFTIESVFLFSICLLKGVHNTLHCTLTVHSNFKTPFQYYFLSFATITPKTFNCSSETKCHVLLYNVWLVDVAHFPTNRKQDIVISLYFFNSQAFSACEYSCFYCFNAAPSGTRTYLSRVGSTWTAQFKNWFIVLKSALLARSTAVSS